MNWKIANYSLANSFSQAETFLIATAGWYKTACTYPGRGVYSVLPWNPPIGQILVLVPRFDREFVKIFVRGKNGAGFEFKFVFNEGMCLK